MKLYAAIAGILLSAAVANAQQMPVIRSNRTSIGIRDGENWQPGSWSLAPEAKPDVYEANLIDGKAHRVTFVTDVDSISFMVELGKKYDFIILHGKDSAYTQVVGARFLPAARFDEAYRRANAGKTYVLTPDVHELVNIAIAITPFAIQDAGLVFKNSDYYKSVRAHFDKHAGHPLVTSLDSVLKRSIGNYFSLKMNGYAFEFDAAGKIVKKPQYDRTAFAGERVNSLDPFLARLQSFSDATGFRAFYASNRALYDQQIAFYRDTADIAAMKNWLDGNFPATRYDSYKVIFSPLVASNQSATWLTNNGFRELQAHVNFPWVLLPDTSTLSELAKKLRRGNIVFTELNHGYINPEADKYPDRIASAISNRDFWVEKSKGPGYYGGNATFNEYMNWAVAALRLVDQAPAAEQAALLASIETMMMQRRGFPQYGEFMKFLVPLYRDRPKGKTLADLYPAIIDWFAAKNSAK